MSVSDAAYLPSALPVRGLSSTIVVGDGSLFVWGELFRISTFLLEMLLPVSLRICSWEFSFAAESCATCVWSANISDLSRLIDRSASSPLFSPWEIKYWLSRTCLFNRDSRSATTYEVKDRNCSNKLEHLHKIKCGWIKTRKLNLPMLAHLE